MAVHAHVPWRRGTGAEAAPRLQPGGARGWAARIPQERACAPGTCAPGTCESVLCLFPRASTPQACIQAGLSVHTHAHTSVHQTQHHAHTSRTHTHRHAHTSGTHTPSHTHALLRANTPSWTHPITRTHTLVHIATCASCRWWPCGGPGTPLSQEEDPPQDCRTPQNHTTCPQLLLPAPNSEDCAN